MTSSTVAARRATLDQRRLGRATLARQLLLERSPLPVDKAVEHLAGVQAQTTTSWYTGLWSRLRDFDPRQAADGLLGRRLVRIALMRSTIHLVTARDCVQLRPLLAPVLERSLKGAFGRRLVGVDRDELGAAARALVEQAPRTFSELGALLGERWPEHDGQALAMAARTWLPLVQLPPRGVWGASGLAAHTTAEHWLGPAPAADLTLPGLVRRYLAAFGPATVRDVQAWCGLTRLREVVADMRSELMVFQDADGRELFDLPEAPRPEADVPAPPRFLYEFDNLLLSHADRRRVVTEEFRQACLTARQLPPSAVLVDGVTAAVWRLTRDKRSATLTVEPFHSLAPADVEAVHTEGERLLAFLAPDADSPQIRVVAPR